MTPENSSGVRFLKGHLVRIPHGQYRDDEHRENASHFIASFDHLIL